jgi:hypothetical protein
MTVDKNWRPGGSKALGSTDKMMSRFHSEKLDPDPHEKEKLDPYPH